jgi:hypothetical protein
VYLDVEGAFAIAPQATMRLSTWGLRGFTSPYSKTARKNVRQRKNFCWVYLQLFKGCCFAILPTQLFQVFKTARNTSPFRIAVGTEYM